MYGTPPHIRQSHHDVPMPRGDDSNGIPGCTGERFRVFAALSSLTDVLGLYLEDLYTIRDRPAATLDLDAWRDSLPGDVRRIIVRGTDLRVPGSANLRLCFLAARFVSCRLQLADTDTTTTPGQQQQQQGLPGDRLQHVRQVAEDIVLFVHELGEEQLGDFWLPHAAFVLSSTATFLIRLAVQAAGAAQSLSLSLAKDLVASLRAHKQTHGWELGDICLDQYGHVVDNLDTSAQLPLGDGGGVGYWDPGVDGGMPNFLDSIIADQWDPMLWGEMA